MSNLKNIAVGLLVLLVILIPFFLLTLAIMWQPWIVVILVTAALLFLASVVGSDVRSFLNGADDE